MNKKASLNIRFTSVQLRKIRQAAQLESKRRGERMDPSTLVRDLVMPRVEDIIGSAVAVAAIQAGDALPTLQEKAS